MANTVLLKGDAYVRKEAVADSAITPGYLIQFGGSSYDVQVHDTVGGAARKAFALENDLIGKDIDDAYAAGDVVQYIVCPAGIEINAVVSESVTKGDALESNGDGRLRVSSTPIEGSIVAWAMATRSGAGRLRVEVA